MFKKYFMRMNDDESTNLCALSIQAHRICEQLHNMNLDDLSGKTIGKVHNTGADFDEFTL